MVYGMVTTIWLYKKMYIYIKDKKCAHSCHGNVDKSSMKFCSNILSRFLDIFDLW